MESGARTVVIVGGGLMGLSAAFHLRRADRRVRVIVLDRARPRLGAADRDEADVQRVAVGADLGHAVGVEREPDADHLRGAATEHLLERALRRGEPRGLPALAEELQHQRRAVADRQHRRDPAAQVGEPHVAFAVEPVVVRGQDRKSTRLNSSH